MVHLVETAKIIMLQTCCVISVQTVSCCNCTNV